MTTRSDIAQLRLYNQRISFNCFHEPTEVVRWLVASQAQDYAGATWALGLRMQAATDRRIEQAFDDGMILRTHMLRPTWHFVMPADIRWLLELTAPRVHAVNATLYRQLALDDHTLKRAQSILVEELQQERYRTRTELQAAFQKAGIPAADGSRLSYLLMAAELDGVICSGPRRGKQFTYALLEERVPQVRPLSRDEALAELAGRYFPSRGPATVQDFAKWSGLTVTDARRGLAAVRSQLESAVIDKQEYWFSAPSGAEQAITPDAQLLSVYDEYVSSYKDRSPIATAETQARLVALGNDLRYIIVMNGQIVGTWKRNLQTKEAVIELSHFAQPTDSDTEAIARAAQRYGKFLELPVTLV